MTNTNPQGIQKNSNSEPDSPVKKRKDGDRSKKKKRASSKDRKNSVVAQGDDEGNKAAIELELANAQPK